MIAPVVPLLLVSFFAASFRAQGASSSMDLPTTVDPSRNRAVPVTIHLPSTKAAQPLILVSHGGGGSRHSLYALAKGIADRGYVVMCLEHVTSNTSDLRRRMRTKGLGFRQALIDCGDDMAARENRPLDIRFAIDLATRLNGTDERFQNRIDLSKVAIVGHSYGAYTALVACGARPVGIEANLAEPRITMGVGLSPQSANGKFFDQGSFASVTCPFVGISGTRDLAGEGHRDFFKWMPKGDKHLLWFHDANHFSFSDPTGGPRSLPQPDTDVTRALQILVPNLLDHYLRGKPALNQALRDQWVKESLRGNVQAIDWQMN